MSDPRLVGVPPPGALPAGGPPAPRAPMRERVAFGFAIALVVATFLLLIVGGIVHAEGAGLACPDWPTCYGSFFPPMVGKVFFEHGHRLFATLVGNLTILLCVIVFLAKPAGHPARRLAAGGIALVIWQGILGGMTVMMRLPDSIATAHLGTSMLFFSLVLWTLFRLRPATSDQPLSPRLVRAIAATTGFVYLQILLGGLVRHTDSGLACTSLPLCGGAIWPFGADWHIQLHMAHRVGAIVVAIAVIGTSFAVLRGAPRNGLARTFALVAPGLVVVQIALGVLTVMTAIEVGTVTSHMATGALLLGTMVSMWLAATATSGAWVPAREGAPMSAAAEVAT